MADFEMSDDEVVLYEGDAKCKEAKGTSKVVLTSKGSYLKKARDY